MIRCNEIFHLLLSFRKRTLSLCTDASLTQQQSTFQSLSETRIITAGPTERYLGEKVLFKGSSSPTVTYSSIIQESEETVNLHPVRIQGYEKQRATVDCSVTPSMFTSADLLFLSYCKLWMYCTLKFSMSKNSSNNNLGLKMQIQMETIKRLLTLVSLTEVNAIGPSS